MQQAVTHFGFMKRGFGSFILKNRYKPCRYVLLFNASCKARIFSIKRKENIATSFLFLFPRKNSRHETSKFSTEMILLKIWRGRNLLSLSLSLSLGFDLESDQRGIFDLDGYFSTYCERRSLHCRLAN